MSKLSAQIWHLAKFEQSSNLKLCKICTRYKFGTLPNLSSDQIGHSAKFEHCTSLALCLIWVHKFGTLPKLSAQIRQNAKLVQCSNLAECQIDHCSNLVEYQICTVVKFSRVSNLMTAQIWQSAKFVQTI